MYRFPVLFFLLTSLNLSLLGQPLSEQISTVKEELAALEAEKSRLLLQLEELKLSKIQEDLTAIGLPGEAPIMHSALALEYAEEHEQARWVAHIILPDIITGNVARTNDFRVDPLVSSGTAVEEDYFLKYLQPDSTYEYDGFGYDRGHLAPSADFRWSQKALSESYFYSNMSPQLADFNREGWAELEGFLRGYIYDNPGTQLYVVTGPVLEEDLPVLERSVNELSIPRMFYKVALDLENERAIAFLVPHEAIEYPLDHYAVPVDEVEAITGLDFFNQLPDAQEQAIEGTLEKLDWFEELAQGDVQPIYAPSLQPGHFNTIQARQQIGRGREVKVCGTVVGTRYSRSGNAWLNVDKRFPNQVFSVFIRKADLVNFSYEPTKELLNQEVCFEGEVENFNGTPTMNLSKEEEVSLGIPLREEFRE